MIKDATRSISAEETASGTAGKGFVWSADVSSAHKYGERTSCPLLDTLKFFTLRSNSNLLITLLAIALTCSLSACTQKAADPKLHHAQDEASLPVVPTVKVESRVLNRDLLLPGEILPYQDVPLYPKIPGFIKWIGVDRGYWVKKGQVLAQLVAPEVEAQRHECEAKMLQARAQISEAQQKLSSARALVTESKAHYKANQDTYARLKKAAEIPGVISGNELEDWAQKAEGDLAAVQSREEIVKAAEAQLASAKDAEKAAAKALDHIKELLAYLTITAPYDGMITERNMHVGSFAYPPHGQAGYPPMLRIKQLSLLRIVIPVPEYAIDAVDVGTNISFKVSAYPERTFVGKVARIAHSLDVKTRTEPVELNYWNTDRTVDPGMFPEVIWPMKRSYRTNFVPSTAIYESLETPFVVKIKDGVAHRIEVRRGQTMGDDVEVFGNLQPDDLVAEHGTENLAEGMEVRPEAAKGKEPEAPTPATPQG
ncbi:MAG: efflux RND transporter periplasmic adaptor subunit [Candidatus Obscuribacterales bacterium]|nr:efflux RND transporter periplasmic adaptor subunit [Candidatus Obscuribacterales bacterium]